MFLVLSAQLEGVLESLVDFLVAEAGPVQFSEPGPYTIEVNVEAVAGSPMGIFVESAKFGVVVE